MFKVEKVTFFEDRASVCRVETLSLKSGIHTFSIPGLSPYLADKSLVFECENPNVVCVEMHAKRSFKSNTGSLEELKAKREKLEQLESETAFNANALAALKFTLKQIMAKILKDCKLGKADSKIWHEALRDIKNSENKILQKDRELRSAKDKFQEEINELQIQHLQIKKEYRSEITLSLDVKEAAECTVKVHYITAAACWRPNYKAIVQADKLVFKKGASIWQNCGEEWENILVEFSTERQQKARIPELSGDCLKVRRKASEELVIREELIEEKELVQQSTYEVPGIEDDGAVFKCLVEKRATVPSSEQSTSLDSEEFTSNFNRELVCYAMLTDSVNEIVHFENTSGQPLLPAPVSIYKNDTLCGLSEVKYTAPGQKIRLDLGNLADVVVKRRENKKYDSKLLSSWQIENHKVQINISNLGPREIHFTLKERVPVSETDKAKVEVLEKNTAPLKFPDDKGIIEWQVNLHPYAQKSIKLSYDLKTHS